MHLVTLANQFLNPAASETEITEALPFAMEKLQRILARTGDEGILNPGYIAQLVAEHINQTRFAEQCLSAQRKETPRLPARTPHPQYHCFYCITN